MQFENICPFVRYAVKTTYLPNRYMVKAQDCRLFYTITGSGTFVTPDSSYPLKPGSLVLYPAGHAYMPLPEKEDKLLFSILITIPTMPAMRTLCRPVVPPLLQKAMFFPVISTRGLIGLIAFCI